MYKLTRVKKMIWRLPRNINRCCRTCEIAGKYGARV